MNYKQVAPIFIILFSTPTFATLDEVIVTGSYSPVTSEQLSSSVTVINHDQLLQLSNNSLVDALRQVPSIWVEEQGGPGGITSISLRGAESNHTLVLLDGVQLNDPTNTRGGAFDVNGINIESVQRIEIIRGAQSSVYGSDALAGVIQIITAEAGRSSTQLNASVGEDGYKTAGISSSGKINQLGYAFTAQSKNAGESILNNIHSGSTAKNNEVISKLKWGNTIHQLDFTYRYFDGSRTSFPEQSGGPVYAESREVDTSDYTDKSSALAWKMQINDFWKSKTQATWYQRNEDLKSPGIEPFDAVPPNGANTVFTRTDFQWINTLGNQDSIWSNIGAETKHEDGTSKGYLGVDFTLPTASLARTINSVFININGYVKDDLLLQASVRRDEATNATPKIINVSKNTSQAGARYQINETLSLFLNAGQGFKLPSFFALGNPLVGNPDLKPETATTQDIGIELKQANYSLNICYFDHHYRDLIDFDYTTFKNVNRSRVETSGVEAEINWQVNTQWLVRTHATYTDTDMLSSNTHLLGRPQVKAGSSISYSIDDAWNINVNYLWVSSRFAVSRYTHTDEEETLSPHSSIDTNVTWKINARTQLSLDLKNTGDSNYENDIGFPAIGRTALMNITFSL